MNKMRRFWVGILLLLFVTTHQAVVHAAPGINTQIPFYGTLKNSLGETLSGDYDMVFRLYDAPTGGTLLETSTHTEANGNVVTVTDGDFAVLLGSGPGNSLDGVDFNDDTIYVGVSIEGDTEMTPRERLGAAAYAFNSDTVDSYHAHQLLRYNATGSITATAPETLFYIRQNGTGDIFNVFDGGSEVFSIIDGGYVGVGTTTPAHTFSVDGDMFATGRFFDSGNSAGTNGMVLLTTGIGTQWVATSSLGISGGGGGGSLFTDAGDVTYLTSVTDQLAIGTSTVSTNARLTVRGGLDVTPGDTMSIVASISTSTVDQISQFTIANDVIYFPHGTAFEDGIHGYDITDPQNPAAIDYFFEADSGDGLFVEVAGSYAYTLHREFDGVPGDLRIYDISDSDAFRMLSETNLPLADGVVGLEQSGHHVFAITSFDISVFDVSNPSAPTIAGGYTNLISYENNPTALYNDLLFVVSSDGPDDYLEIFDVSDVTDLQRLGSTSVGSITNITVDGNHAYVVDDSNLDIYDISTPGIFTLLGSFNPGTALHSVAVRGHVAYVTLTTQDRLLALNIKDPANIRPIASFTDAVNLNAPRAIEVHGNYAYIATEYASDRIVIVDLGGITSPTAEIGSLLSQVISTNFLSVDEKLHTGGALVVGDNAYIHGTFAALGGGTTTNPLAQSPKLYVNGTGVGILNNDPQVYLHVGGTVVTDGTTLIRLQDSNSSCNFTANVPGPTCGSDRTLKKDIDSIDNSLALITRLSPKFYRWETDVASTALQSGFIAQEVQAVLPELVATSTWIDGTDRLFLNTTGMLPYIVGAIGEQYRSVEELLRTGTVSTSTSPLFAHLSDGKEDTFWEKLVRIVNDVTNGVLAMVGLNVTEELTVGSETQPIGITLFDTENGEPYCLSMKGGVMVSISGTCEEAQFEVNAPVTQPATDSNEAPSTNQESDSDLTTTSSTTDSMNEAGASQAEPIEAETTPSATSSDENVESDSTEVTPPDETSEVVDTENHTQEDSDEASSLESVQVEVGADTELADDIELLPETTDDSADESEVS